MQAWPISPMLNVVLAVALVAAIAVVDHLTGIDLRIYPLYFVPIGIAAWRGPARLSALIPLLSTAAWMASNALSEEAPWSTLVWTINCLTQATAFFTIGMLIAELRKRLAYEHRVSRQDPLTGLANSRAFHEQGARLVASVSRAGQPVTLAYLDLDNFKTVNDTRGHLEGDRVLRSVAEALSGELRASDLAARLGGDEFAVLLPNTGAEGAAALLERLRQRIASRMAEHDWPVTVSVGAVGYAHAPGSLQDAVRDADALMYAAKRQGKDRVYIQAGGAADDSPRAAASSDA